MKAKSPYVHRDKDLRKILKQLKDLGWNIVETGRGHIKAYPPSGTEFALISGSTDPRAIKNIRSVLRRLGADL
jgi:hypothetical protein